MYLAYSLYSTPIHAYGGCVKSLLDPNVWLSTVQAKPTADSWRDMLESVVVREILQALGFCDRASWANCEEREKTNKMQQSDVYYQHCLNMFRALLCPSSGE